eukprot:PhM_4_TR1734/c0_g1_i5/m.86873
MRSFHLRAFPQRQFARKARRTSSSCPVFSITASSLFSMSTTSSLPISAVAAAWYSTTATRRPLRSALEKHLALLSKGGLDDCTIKLLQDVAVHDDTAQFEVMVEKVHAAVRYKTFYTDSDGPDMLLAEFRTLVAGCRADAPAVQRLLATLTYGQRASMESVKMHSAFPGNCRDWLYVAVKWDGRQRKQDKLASRTLRYHAAAVALQILRDRKYCLPLRPGTVTHMTYTVSQSDNCMLGQCSYIKQFAETLVKSFEPRDKIPFLVNYSTPRAGKSTVLMNGLQTAPLEKLEGLTLHNEQRYALVVVAASLNNTTPFQEYRDLQAGTVEEAFFAVDWRLIYAMLRPLLTQLDSFDLVIISKQIARAGSQSDYGCGVKWVQQLLKLVSQERLGMEAPPLVRYVLCIDEFTTLLDALWKKVMAQKRNKDECKSVLESFGTNIVANYLHDQSRVLLSGFTEDTKTFATASGRQSWPVYLDVLRDVDLMPGSQYGAFVQRIVLHLHDTFTEDNIVTWFRDNAVALRKAKVNSSDLVQQGRQCCEGVHG